MKPGPNDPCPCGAGRKYKRCCGPLHEGVPASTAEALMRSRYCAYALGLSDYILATTHPDSPLQEPDRAAWRADVDRFSRATTFRGLTVGATTTDGDRATVPFVADLVQGGRAVPLAERSLFFRVAGRWLYHSGSRPEEP